MLVARMDDPDRLAVAGESAGSARAYSIEAVFSPGLRS
jgi:hypothetical protein